jgi:type II secretory pathway pseudopilin PulG
MWKIIILNNQKKKAADRGFITLEIIIALLIAFGFLMVSLQTLVAAMAFKVQAQEKQKADKLIQEDIESIQDRASGNVLTPRLAAILTNNDDATTGFNPNSSPPIPIDDVCNAANYNQGYAQALWYAFTNQDYDGDKFYSSPLIDQSDLNNDGTIDADSMNPGEAIATNPDYQLEPKVSFLSKVKNDGTIEKAGNTLTLTRTHVTATTGKTPFTTLGIHYRVTKPDENGDNEPEVIAQRYVEVIPDAALECP